MKDDDCVVFEESRENKQFYLKEKVNVSSSRDKENKGNNIKGALHPENENY